MDRARVFLMNEVPSKRFEEEVPMSKIFSMTMVGLAAAALMLEAPTSSQAQVPLGLSVNVGPVGVSAGYLPGYAPAPYPVVVPPPVVYPSPAYPAYPVAPSVVVRAGVPVWGPCWGHRHWHGRRH
jgi:hypothetical protein